MIDPASGIATPRSAARHHARTSWRDLLIVGGPLGIALVLLAIVVPLGFNPTDEGLVQAYARRILAGEMPHRDFVSPRPVGSSIFHAISLALPGAWILFDRCLAATEIAVATLAMTCLTWWRRPWRFPAYALALTVAAVAMNMHTFPLMAWYTIDGMALVSAGYCLVGSGISRGRSLSTLGGLVLLGAAVVTKQSFVPAAIIGVAWVGLASSGSQGGLIRRFAPPLAAAGALPVAYVVVVAASGGWSSMVTQLTTVPPSFLAAPLGLLADGPGVVQTGLAAMLVGLSIAWARTGGGRRDHVRTWTLLAAIATLAIVAVSARFGGLRYDTPWAMPLLLIGAIVASITSLLDRRLDLAGYLIVSVAWMVSLSAGVPYPNLAAGSLALYILARIWLPTPGGMPEPLVRAAPWLVAVASVIIVSTVAWSRTDVVYRDRPASMLTARMDDISPAFWGVRSNPVTRDFIAEVKRCAARYPASRVAVIPDGAGLYPALGLTAALPIDWLWPPDYKGSEDRILDSARGLARDGDALVLWQTAAGDTLSVREDLPVADALMAVPFDRDSSLGPALRAAFGGLNDHCGSFLVRYFPPHPAAAP